MVSLEKETETTDKDKIFPIKNGRRTDNIWVELIHQPSKY